MAALEAVDHHGRGKASGGHTERIGARAVAAAATDTGPSSSLQPGSPDFRAVTMPGPAPPRPAPPRPLPATRTQALLSASSVPRLFASGTSCRGSVTHVLRHDAPEKGGETLLRGEASAAGDVARSAHITG